MQKPIVDNPTDEDSAHSTDIAIGAMGGISCLHWCAVRGNDADAPTGFG